MSPVGNTSKIENALFYHLGQLSLTPTRRVAWPDYQEPDGSPFTPLQDEIYLQPTVFWNISQRGEIGLGAPNRHIGILQIMTRGPIGVSSLPQKEVVDEIISHFDREVITRNSITVRFGSFTGGTSVPYRGSEFDDDGRNHIPVSVPFWCDIFPA